MGRFTVDPNALQSVDVAIGECVAHSDAGLAGLRASVDRARWRGAAAHEFRLGFEHWVEGVEGLLGSLRELGTALAMSGSSYAATDTQVQVAVEGTAP